MKLNTKIKIFRFLLGKDNEFVLVDIDRSKAEGTVAICTPDESATNLVSTAKGMMEIDSRFKNFILDTAKSYLQRYEIDCKNFCKEVYNKE